MMATSAASVMKEEGEKLAILTVRPCATVCDGRLTKDVWKLDAYALEKRAMSASMAIEILHDPDKDSMLAHLYGPTWVSYWHATIMATSGFLLEIWPTTKTWHSSW